MPCREFKDARLRRVGVEDRSLLPRELELGALRSGGFAALFGLEGEAFPWLSRLIIDGATGEEAGRGVEATVESESSFMSSESRAPSFFVDLNIILLLECSGAGGIGLVFSMSSSNGSFTAAARSSFDNSSFSVS